MTHQYMEIKIKELEKRIKAFEEQEPFMNKPCVAHKVCHEDKVKVLDKIRERIELEKLGYPPSAGYYKAIVKVLQIIDKYKGESEQVGNPDRLEGGESE